MRRTGPLTTPATVSFTTNNGTATGGTGPGDDFTPTSGVLAFAANVPTRTITVALQARLRLRARRGLLDLTLRAFHRDPAPCRSSITVNIPNDDFGGTFSFGAPTYTVLESKPSVLLTVKRTGGLANADVTYTTANGTATSGSDFTGTAGSLLHFAAGKTSATLTIPILQDTIGEGSETFSVTLSSPTAGGTLGTPATSTVTIQDDDRLVSFGAATYAVKEPLTGTVNLLIPVKRTGPAGAFNVNYSVAGHRYDRDRTSRWPGLSAGLPGHGHRQEPDLDRECRRALRGQRDRGPDPDRAHQQHGPGRGTRHHREHHRPTAGDQLRCSRLQGDRAGGGDSSPSRGHGQARGQPAERLGRDLHDHSGHRDRERPTTTRSGNPNLAPQLPRPASR